MSILLTGKVLCSSYREIQKHRQANRIGKELISAQDDLNPNTKTQQEHLGASTSEECQCCGRKIAQTDRFSFCENVEDKFGHYGPNIPIYYSIYVRLFFFMLFLSTLFSVHSFIANLQGNYCQIYDDRCDNQNSFYLISVYNIIQNKQEKFVQMILLICVCVFIIFFNIYLRLYTNRKYEQINNRNLTDSDYSILVRRLPPDTQIQDIYGLIEEIAKDLTNDELLRSRNLRVFDIIMIKNLEEASAALDRNYKNFQKALEKQQVQYFIPEEIPQPYLFSQAALVKFYSIRANEVINMDTTFGGRVKQYIFPFWKAPTKYQVKGQYVAIERAPQPTDINWVNFGYKDKSRIKRKIIFWLLAVLTLLISAGVLYGVSEGQEAIKASTGSSNIGFTIMTIILLFFFNFVIYQVLNISTNQIKLYTKTEQKIDLLQKTVVFEVANLGFFSLFLPFLVKLPNAIEGAQSLSLPYVVLFTMILQTFLYPTISFLFGFFEIANYLIPKFLLKHNFLTYTQKQANHLLTPIEIRIVFKYSTAVTFLLFGCTFSIISPICLPIAAIGVLVTYFYEKYLLQKRYRIPEYGSPQLNSEFIDTLDLVPILISAVSLGLHALSVLILEIELQTRHYVALYVNLGIGGVNMVMPWNFILKNLRFIKIEAQVDIPYNQASVGVTYEQIVPLLPDQKKDLIKKMLEDRRKVHEGNKIAQEDLHEKIQSFRTLINLKNPEEKDSRPNHDPDDSPKNSNYQPTTLTKIT